MNLIETLCIVSFTKIYFLIIVCFAEFDITMSCPIATDDLDKLKFFVGFFSQNPSALDLPELEFFKTYIEKFGSKDSAGEPINNELK